MTTQLDTIIADYSDVLKRNPKSISFVGALRIGEADKLRGLLTRAGCKPAGRKVTYGNGEWRHERYLLPN